MRLIFNKFLWDGLRMRLFDIDLSIVDKVIVHSFANVSTEVIKALLNWHCFDLISFWSFSWWLRRCSLLFSLFSFLKNRFFGFILLLLFWIQLLLLFVFYLIARFLLFRSRGGFISTWLHWLYLDKVFFIKPNIISFDFFLFIRFVPFQIEFVIS